MGLKGCGLAKTFAASVAFVRSFPRVCPHVPAQARRLEEAFVAHLAEMSSVIRVLLPVKNDAVTVGKPGEGGGIYE